MAMGRALRVTWFVVLAGCGGEPEVTPVEHAASPAPPPAVVTSVPATATDATEAPSATASAKPSDEPDLPKAHDRRGVSKRADGACFEFVSKPCPPGQTCKPPQPRRVRCPD